MANTKRKRGRPKGSKSRSRAKAKGKGKGRGCRRGLSGFDVSSPGQKATLVDSLMTTGKVALSMVGGVVVGAAIGRPSLYLGAPLAIWAFYKKKPLLGAAALSSMLIPVSVPVSAPTQPVAGTEDEMEGFDTKKMIAGAKDRVHLLAKSFADKLYLPAAKTDANKPVAGLDGEEVSYFINPYSNGSNIIGEMPDMSALDRIQMQIAQASASNGGSASNNKTIQVSGMDDDDLGNI